MTQRPRSRAFTLIEVILALTIAAVLMSAALITFTSGKYTTQEAARRGQMARDAQLILDMLGRDLQSLGAGVPQGACQDGCGGGVPPSFVPALRRATSDTLVFLGDAAYPNAEVAGAATLTRFLGDTNSARVALTAEITGPCTPPATSASNAFQCSSSATTPLAGSFSAADNCTQAQPNARTCPWALNKWQASNGAPVHLTFVDAVGDFYQRQWTGTKVAVDNYLGIEVQQEPGGNAVLPRTSFYDPMGSGYVVQLDRIFWSVEDAGGGACDAGDRCTVRRRQCWGRLDAPSAADFPAVGTGAYTSANTPRNCSAPGDGTPWETIADGVTNFELTYFGPTGIAYGNSVAVANLGNVRSILVSLEFESRVNQGPVLRHRVQQRLFLPNREVE